jgi:FtsP/CotA-like multicopper oxidase with cupredoxin domain
VNHALDGMNGLVMGITVRSSPSRNVAMQSAAETHRRRLRLLVRRNAGGVDASPFYAFALQEGAATPPLDSGLRVGPPIVLTRGEPVSITVANMLGVPTAVHWHGIELESYFDGVAGFSGAGPRITPVIAPNDSFEARFTPPRAGTFIYHTHVDETRQQPAGLAGPLIVVEPGARFDPATDHPVLITTPHDWDDERRTVLLNGSLSPRPLVLRSGTTHRLRFINITVSRPGIRLELRRDTVLARWRPMAKDGADLAPAQRVLHTARAPISIGETIDVELGPEPPGDLRLDVVASNGAVIATLLVLVRP